MQPDPTPSVLPVILFLALLAAVFSDPTARSVVAAISQPNQVGDDIRIASAASAASAERGSVNYPDAHALRDRNALDGWSIKTNP